MPFSLPFLLKELVIYILAFFVFEVENKHHFYQQLNFQLKVSEVHVLKHLSQQNGNQGEGPLQRPKIHFTYV